MLRTFFFLLLITFSGITSTAQSFDKAKLDQYFDSLNAHQRFMGSVAIAKDNKIIYTKAVGFADIANKIPATPNTKYRIGSISKTFTTVLVLKAAEEKKLQLNQTIDKYFPAIKNASTITILNLLQHRSGIHNITDDESYLTWNTVAKTEQEMIDIIVKAGSDFQSGKKASYSNSNFILLTYILEHTYNKPYQELIAKHITTPLKLKNTFVGTKIKTEKNEAVSYHAENGWQLEPETDMSIPVGAGAIVSTPSDLVLFSNALFGGKLVNDSSLALMKTMRDDYGTGLFETEFHEKKGFGHNGGIDGFISNFVHFDDGNYSFALTSNAINYESGNMYTAIMSAIFGQPFDLPIHMNSSDLDALTGIYSSPGVPLKITITNKDATLFAQATGQSAFPLDPVSKTKFRFDPAGIVIEFMPAEKKFIIIQGGRSTPFSKE